MAFLPRYLNYGPYGKGTSESNGLVFVQGGVMNIYYGTLGRKCTEKLSSQLKIYQPCLVTDERYQSGYAAKVQKLSNVLFHGRT